jgi:gliding motility-associated-like protein
VGSAKITVTSGGSNPYEYSVDGGANYGALISGNPVNNLPPNGTYNILVRDDQFDLCPATVSVTINNAVGVTDILTALTITDATCANNDGKVLVGAISGGGGGYTYTLDGVNKTSTTLPNTFTGLVGGAHIFSVTDANSCTKNFPFTINFPGLVNFATNLISNPSCSGGGSDGAFAVTITSLGSFQAGVTTDPLNLPTFTPPVASAGNLVIPFTGLSKNTYYLYVQSVGSLCPTKTTFSISGGVDKIDFLAKGNDFICFTPNKLDGKVTLSNVRGEANKPFNYQIFSKPRTTGDLAVLQGFITAQEALSDVVLPSSSISGLRKGDYEILLSQNQTSCLVQSIFKSFTVNGPISSLDTLYVRGRGTTPQERKRIISLPDIATGFVNIGIAQSGTEPYKARVELVNPNPDPKYPPFGFDSGWRNVPLVKVDNVDTYQISISNLYAGVYRLSISDALGCEKSYYNYTGDFNDPKNFLKVDVDTKIEIPNVFTPNNDGANDEFYIRNLPDNSTVSVASRWGAEVYASSNYKNDWNGGSTPDGIYYYRINAGGSVFTGWVEIIRGK